MNPGTNLLDPFGLLTGGSMAAWQLGWRMLEVWQRAWLPLVDSMLSAGAPARQPLPLFPTLPFVPVAPLTALFPFADIFPRVEARLTPIPGQAGDEPAARLSMRVQMPEIPGAMAAEQLSIEALIARKQGRESAWLGCLQGVKVVYPKADSLPQPAVVEITSAATKLPAQPLPAKPATGKAVAAKAPPRRKAASSAATPKPRVTRE